MIVAAVTALIAAYMTGVALPNPRLTPGATVTTDLVAVCRPGYAHGVRPTGAAWHELRVAVLKRYGLPANARGYTIDHLVPLELGGAPTSLLNLWPEPRDEAKKKDRIEDRLHRLVCSGRMNIHDAQRAVERDWRTSAP